MGKALKITEKLQKYIDNFSLKLHPVQQKIIDYNNENTRLSIYSILGEKVFDTILNQDQLTQGFIKWDPLNTSLAAISSGAYIIRAENNIMASSKKILFIK